MQQGHTYFSLCPVLQHWHKFKHRITKRPCWRVIHGLRNKDALISAESISGEAACASFHSQRHSVAKFNEACIGSSCSRTVKIITRRIDHQNSSVLTLGLCHGSCDRAGSSNRLRISGGGHGTLILFSESQQLVLLALQHLGITTMPCSGLTWDLRACFISSAPLLATDRETYDFLFILVSSHCFRALPRFEYGKLTGLSANK